MGLFKKLQTGMDPAIIGGPSNKPLGEQGYDPAVFGASMNEWIARMGKSQAVGKAFRSELGY